MGSHRCSGRLLAVALLAAALPPLGGCAVCNYVDPAGPRYAGRAEQPSVDREPDAIRVVSFNVRLALCVEAAAAALRAEDALRDADVVLLQEMSADGAARIAGALGMHHVYYPGTVRTGGIVFGVAILSRWPITEDHKLVLPHRNPVTWVRSIAVGATLAAPGGPIAVYSVHAATVIVSLRARLDQYATVLQDVAARHDPGVPVVIAGDLNTMEQWAIPRVHEGFRARGFEPATAELDATADYFFGSVVLDHVFARGLDVRDAGTVRTDASDHRAVWSVLRRPADDRARP